VEVRNGTVILYTALNSNQSLVTLKMKVTEIGTNLALVLRLVLTILLVFARLDLTPDFWYPECQ